MRLFTTSDDETFNEEDLIWAIYKRNERILYKTVKEFLTDSRIAEDLVQEAMEKLVRKAEKLRYMDERAQNAYAYKVFEHTVLSYVRRREVEKKIFSEEDFEVETRTIADPAPSPEDIVIHQEEFTAYCAAIKKLPKVERELLYGKYFLHLSDRELAESAGCAVASVRMKLTRARRDAQKMLKEGGYIDEES